MRHQPKTDGNQKYIVKRLREEGCSVAITTMVGNGFPDLVVGTPAPCIHCNELLLQNFLIEVKDPASSAERQRLNGREQRFHDNWRGGVYAVKSLNEVLLYAGKKFRPVDENT